MTPSEKYREQDFIVRTMTEADLPAACRLWSAVPGVELAEGDSLVELSAFLRRNLETSQVAYAGDRLVGAVLAGHDGRRGLIYHLAVASDQRGHGLGRAMVSRALVELKAAGIGRAIALVARDNESGRAFWLRCGWEVLEFAEPIGIDL